MSEIADLSNWEDDTNALHQRQIIEKAIAKTSSRYRRGFGGIRESMPHLGATCAALEQWCAEFEPKGDCGLYLHGATGTGKTGLAQAVKLALCERNYVVDSWNSAKLMDTIRDSYNPNSEHNRQEIMRFASGDDYRGAAHLFILDDLGTERSSEHDLDVLYLILNLRYDEMRPVLVTSNHSLKSLLAAHVDDLAWQRLISRLAEMCEEIGVPAAARPDQRLTARRRRGKEAEDAHRVTVPTDEF